MLSARNLVCRRGGRDVLQGIDLDVHSGEVLGVLGANGAGKTTLLATLAGELAVSAGTLELDGNALAGWSPAALARKRAVLPQSPTLSFDLSVREVVAMGAYPFPELPPARLNSLLRQALQHADAIHLAERRYLGLSGGEQQRVQFARVLTQVLACREGNEGSEGNNAAAGRSSLEGQGRRDYRALLLDEPTSSLDPRHQLLLLRVVRQVAREQGVAALVVLHDVNLAAQYCDRLLMLAQGSHVALGAPSEVLTPEILARVYDIPARVLVHPEHVGTPLVVFGL